MNSNLKMYQVKIKHYKPSYRKGDLEDTTELINVKTFKLRKDAKEFIESQLKGQSQVSRNYKRGNETSYCRYWTNKTWIHENTGDKCTESFIYELMKI